MLLSLSPNLEKTICSNKTHTKERGSHSWRLHLRDGPPPWNPFASFAGNIKHTGNIWVQWTQGKWASAIRDGRVASYLCHLVEEQGDKYSMLAGLSAYYISNRKIGLSSKGKTILAVVDVKLEVRQSVDDQLEPLQHGDQWVLVQNRSLHKEDVADVRYLME